MKKTLLFLSAFLFFLTNTIIIFGQETSPNPAPQGQHFEEPAGYMTFGLDVGLAYQSSDVKSAFGGYGIGLTLEKNLTHTLAGAADFGVRGRLMYSKTGGYNLTPSTGIASNPAVNGTYNPVVNYTSDGSYYANYRTDQAELGIEAVLTLNRLRERTGVYATLFGGFGLDYYDVKVDQLNGNNQKYAYSTLKPTTVADVKGFLDGTFETKADGFADGGQFTFMPNLGLELGYHFSPRFMVVLGHKLTFAKNDLLDGQQWLDKTTLTAKPDFHHYTNLQFKWIIGNRKRQVFDGDPPKVTILQPRLNPYNTYDGIENVRAEVLGVTFQEDVSLSVNGLQSNFSFKNNVLTADVLLTKGENTIIVKGENQYGSDFKKLVINVLEKQRLPEPPVVVTPSTQTYPQTNPTTPTYPQTNPTTPTYPQTNPTTQTTQSPRVKFISPASYSETEYNAQAIRVQVDNVTNYQDIALTVNGRSYTNFRFNGNELTFDAPLTEGQNAITVTARNSAGSSSDAATVNYRPAVQRVPLPVVRITTAGTPVENSYGGCQTNIEARVDNVNGQRDITMSVNGRATNDFSYNPSTRILRATVSLATGSNAIAIRALNASGEGNDRVDVNCTQRRLLPPTIRISQPNNNSVTEQNTVDLRAIATNVDNKSQIAVYLNNNQTSDFSFNTYDKSITGRFNLNEGENSVRIRVTNNDGSNEDIVRFTYRPRVVSTPPRVTISQPSNGSAAKIPTVNLFATATNVKDRSQIQVTLNNQTVQSINFEPNSGSITARMTLEAGENTIRVAVSNESGSDAATATVSYSKPVVIQTARPPRITISRPTDGSTVSTATVLLEAMGENVSAARNEVKLIVNGKEIPAMMNVMRQMRQTISLTEGVNTITVRGTNQDGTDEQTVRVTYNKTPKPTKIPDRDIPSRSELPTTTDDSPKPTISNFNVTQPATDPFDPKPLVSVVTATITKAPKAYIQFKVNGEEVKTFEFDELTGQFRYSFGVKSGQSYIFYIRAANIDGETEKTETVKF